MPYYGIQVTLPAVTTSNHFPLVGVPPPTANGTAEIATGTLTFSAMPVILPTGAGIGCYSAAERWSS
ncbi:MAG: hypothetical protein HQL77_13830 [Magnetococcales bacterium]|nr:hypothetical protein [Magnetococcales bacterium]